MKLLALDGPWYLFRNLRHSFHSIYSLVLFFIKNLHTTSTQHGTNSFNWLRTHVETYMIHHMSIKGRGDCVAGYFWYQESYVYMRHNLHQHVSSSPAQNKMNLVVGWGPTSHILVSVQGNPVTKLNILPSGLEPVHIILTESAMILHSFTVNHKVSNDPTSQSAIRSPEVFHS